MSGEIVFEVSSGFGATTRAPYVQVLIHAADFMTQMSPETARELALNLLEAAESAESDGFLVGFIENEVGVSEPSQMAYMLSLFRDYRDKRRYAAAIGKPAA